MVVLCSPVLYCVQLNRFHSSRLARILDNNQNIIFICRKKKKEKGKRNQSINHCQYDYNEDNVQVKHVYSASWGVLQASGISGQVYIQQGILLANPILSVNLRSYTTTSYIHIEVMVCTNQLHTHTHTYVHVCTYTHTTEK